MGLLEKMGYTHAHHYRGGLEDWRDRGGEVEGREALDGRRKRDWTLRVLSVVDHISFRGWIAGWVAMLVVCGLLYGSGLLPGSLAVDGRVLRPTLSNLGTALYFSGVTATTLGFGDVVPTGALRFLAILEAAVGLLIFGAVVTKLVSRRQEQLIEEIHDLTFEERLGRIHQGLHALIGEVHSIRLLCDQGSLGQDRVKRRVESAMRMLSVELSRVHRLLYRPHRPVEENVLESILASLVAALGEFRDLIDCAEGLETNASHEAGLRSIVRAAEEICGDCIPAPKAPRLAHWMDAVRQTAREIRI